MNGQPCEPFEQLVLDVPEDGVGGCMERLGQRRAELQDMRVMERRSRHSGICDPRSGAELVSGVSSCA